LSREEPGDYVVKVGNQSGSFKVIEPPTTEPEPATEIKQETASISDVTPESEPAPVPEPPIMTEKTQDSGIEIRWWLPSAIIAVVVILGIIWLIARKRKFSDL